MEEVVSRVFKVKNYDKEVVKETLCIWEIVKASREIGEL